MEKAMAPHSSTLAWKIPWMEEPGGLQSMGSLRVRQNWATSLSLFTSMHWRRKWQPTPVFMPGESQGWWEPGGLPTMGLHRIGHNWSDLAAAAVLQCMNKPVWVLCISMGPWVKGLHHQVLYHKISSLWEDTDFCKDYRTKFSACFKNQVWKKSLRKLTVIFFGKNLFSFF